MMIFGRNETLLNEENGKLPVLVALWPFAKKILGWSMTPIVVAFLLPIAILLFIWASSLILYIHRVHKRRLMRRLTEAINERDIVKAGREVIAALWDAQVWKKPLKKLIFLKKNMLDWLEFKKIKHNSTLEKLFKSILMWELTDMAIFRPQKVSTFEAKRRFFRENTTFLI